uniref:Alternative protein ENAM n=1 Tax=Homo sapiens TaxID=9606 RepID=L8E8W5_HUMAN|nr:alternative protein ENAM [Homo sapiens]
MQMNTVHLNSFKEGPMYRTRYKTAYYFRPRGYPTKHSWGKRNH